MFVIENSHKHKCSQISSFAAVSPADRIAMGILRNGTNQDTRDDEWVCVAEVTGYISVFHSCDYESAEKLKLPYGHLKTIITVAVGKLEVSPHQDFR